MGLENIPRVANTFVNGAEIGVALFAAGLMARRRWGKNGAGVPIQRLPEQSDPGEGENPHVIRLGKNPEVKDALAEIVADWEQITGPNKEQAESFISTADLIFRDWLTSEEQNNGSDRRTTLWNRLNFLLEGGDHTINLKQSGQYLWLNHDEFIEGTEIPYAFDALTMRRAQSDKNFILLKGKTQQPGERVLPFNFNPQEKRDLLVPFAHSLYRVAQAARDLL